MTGNFTDEEILDFYEHLYDESARLASRDRSLEFSRTADVLERYLPEAPIDVLDVGGGPGVYAGWLAGRGDQVTLIDPVARHVDAVSQLEPLSGSVTGKLGDARSIDESDDSFDAVLMLGPLYHLRDRSDRVAAWSEARRVCRPGETIVAAVISRFASFHDMVTRDRLGDPAIVDLVTADLSTGQHRNPGQEEGFFTTAYFHRPTEVVTEAASAGVDVERVIGVEGFAGHVANIEEQLGDPAKRSSLLDLLRSVEEEPSLLGVSSHLLAIAHV